MTVRETGSSTDEPVFLCQPVAHLAWTSVVRRGAQDEAEHQQRAQRDHAAPRVVEFGVANSAQCTLALAVDWRATDRLASALSCGAACKPFVARAFLQPGTGYWQVADVESMHIVLAHALLDAPVLVRRCRPDEAHAGCPVDRSKLWTDGATSLAVDDESIEEPSVQRDIESGLGWQFLEASSRSRVTCMCDPAVVSHTRWHEACCWPKVWALRQTLRKYGDDAWAEPLTNAGVGLSSVPIKWNAERSSWTAGNRHRIVAALLAQTPFRATFKAKQVLEWGWTSPQSGTAAPVKSPARLWQAQPQAGKLDE